mmetsp:Transcript_7461/g.23322  ORF Transcript_7461/g.23322 Transcript_7461/m.23322 type:complete len:337 (-) Transcript_7461:426-1436(-)
MIAGGINDNDLALVQKRVVFTQHGVCVHGPKGSGSLPHCLHTAVGRAVKSVIILRREACDDDGSTLEVIRVSVNGFEIHHRTPAELAALNPQFSGARNIRKYQDATVRRRRYNFGTTRERERPSTWSQVSHKPCIHAGVRPPVARRVLRHVDTVLVDPFSLDDLPSIALWQLFPEFVSTIRCQPGHVVLKSQVRSEPGPRVHQLQRFRCHFWLEFFCRLRGRRFTDCNAIFSEWPKMNDTEGPTKTKHHEKHCDKDAGNLRRCHGVRSSTPGTENASHPGRWIFGKDGLGLGAVFSLQIHDKALFGVCVVGNHFVDAVQFVWVVPCEHSRDPKLHR